MNNNYAREQFIKYISQIYQQNPTFEITADTIYSELTKFNYNEGRQERLSHKYLINIQIKLKRYYEKNYEKKKVITYNTLGGHFWVIENRQNQSDEEYYLNVRSAIKMYVPVPPQDLERVAISIFNFMISKGIIMQCKIARDLRNDALVLRVANPKDALAVEKFINEELHYHTAIKPNPFTLIRGKIGYAIDGSLSYNSVLAKKLLYGYFQDKKKTNTLKTSSLSDFLSYLQDEYNNLQNSSEMSCEKYQLKTLDEQFDFMMILDLIIKNIEGEMNIEKLISNQQVLNIRKKSPPLGDVQARNYLLFVISGLSNIYRVDEMHTRIMKYIETGKLTYFTRTNKIRYIVQKYLPPQIMEKEIKKMGWEALISVYQETIKKYNYEQANKAVQELFRRGTLEYFTNDNSKRSYLSLIIPIELLKKVIIEETQTSDIYEIITKLTRISNNETQKLIKL